MLDHLSAKYLKRRNFLALCGLSILPELLGACQNGITTTAIGTLAPTSTRQLAVPTEADWATLASQLKGSLIRPGNTQYVSACQLFDPRYDNIKPAAIAYCTSPTDVQNCLAFVRKFALPVAPRSGGHSYAGYSTTSGLLIDVTRMNSVTTDLASDTATIGAGARHHPGHGRPHSQSELTRTGRASGLTGGRNTWRSEPYLPSASHC